MKRLFLIIVLIFLTSSANTVTYNSDPKIFITELVDDALKILSEKSTTVDEKAKNVTLTGQGIIQIQKILNVNNLYKLEDPWVPYILNAIRAHVLYTREVNYIVKNREIQIVDEGARRVIDAVTKTHDLPLSVIAPFREEHSLMRKITPFLMGMSTKAGTVNFLLNASPLRDRIAELSLEANFPLMASSANRSHSIPKAAAVGLSAGS